MHLIELTEDAPELEILEAINEEAIPENERAPLKRMLIHGKPNGLSLLCINEKNHPVGFAVLRSYREIRYLAFFAVAKEFRSRGIGSRVLQLLQERFRGLQFVVEYESTREPCKHPDLRRRRKEFYLRNGFYPTGWYLFYDDTEFEIACSRPDYDAAAFEAFLHFLWPQISDHTPLPYQRPRQPSPEAT